MLGRLVLIFILVPLIDLVLLLRVGQMLGFWETLWLVVLMGFLGATLARWQGLQTIARIQAELTAGRMSTKPLADGALILLAAALLITPGFLTDVLGLLLLIPPVRGLFRNSLTRWFQSRVITTGFATSTEWNPGNAPGGGGYADISAGPRPVKHVDNEALRKQDPS